MLEPDDNETVGTEDHGLLDKVTGFGQKIIGEIETLGGILTGDPVTRAEGEFNTEVGEIREEVAEDLEESDEKTGSESEAGGSW